MTTKEYLSKQHSKDEGDRLAVMEYNKALLEKLMLGGGLRFTPVAVSPLQFVVEFGFLF